jgi:hypothetical protein
MYIVELKALGFGVLLDPQAIGLRAKLNTRMLGLSPSQAHRYLG